MNVAIFIKEMSYYQSSDSKMVQWMQGEPNISSK
jgi:hypothetical protein